MGTLRRRTLGRRRRGGTLGKLTIGEIQAQAFVQVSGDTHRKNASILFRYGCMSIFELMVPLDQTLVYSKPTDLQTTFMASKVWVTPSGRTKTDKK